MLQMLGLQKYICSPEVSLVPFASWIKVRQFQNEFMKLSFLPKYEQKIVKISALTTQGRNPDNFSLVFSSEKQWFHKFILKLSDLGCDFRLVIDLYFSIRKFMNIQWVCTQAKRWRQAVSHQKPRVVAARALQGLHCNAWCGCALTVLFYQIEP